MILFKSIIRGFRKFKLYVLLNLFGLVMGLTCAIVLFLYIAFEFSFDKFHTDKDRIFRVSEIFISPDDKEIIPELRFPIAPELKETYPEIESYCRLLVKSKELLVKHNEKSIAINKTIQADNSYFEFFSFELELGAPNSVLKNDDAIVLTKKVAEALFGSQNPIGSEVICDNKKYIITGIAQNPPLNSHIQFDAIFSLAPVVNDPSLYIGWDGGLSVTSFLKLNKSTSKTNLEAKLKNLLWEKINKKAQGSGFSSEFELEPLDKIHLYSNVDWDVFVKEGYKNVMTLFLIGFLVLVIALINYLFITRGILILRLKEFGIKKYLGISKSGIFNQLAVESLSLFFIAGLLSITLLLVFKQVVIHLFEQDFITFQLIKNLPFLIPGIILISLFTAFLQYLSFKNKVNQLSASNISNFKLRNRKIAYVSAFQFVISITLISSVLLIYKQLNFALNKDLGFKSENIITLSHEQIGAKAESLINEIEKIPGVLNVSASYGTPGLESTANGYQAEGSDEWKMYNAIHVDDNFFETFNIKLVEGRTFKRGKDLDKNVFIINETLAKQLGWENPIGKKIFRNEEHEIIGVAKDFHMASIYEKIPPLIISKEWQNDFYTLSIAISNNNIQATIGGIEKCWSEIMPNTAFNYSFLDDKFEKLYNKVEQTIEVLLILSSLSILIAMLGLFGITMLLLNSKVKEIGIRKVNGANLYEILALFNKDLVKWVVIAFVIACPIAYYAMNKWLENFAYKTELSWWIFALAGVLAMGIALLTVSWQTWRAARRNPVEALRYE